MRPAPKVTFRRIAVPLLAAVGLTLTMVSPALAGTPRTTSNTATSTYLALGDSVPFGFFENYDINKGLGQFVGYPVYVAQALHLNNLVNASCPGETTDSFMDVFAPNLGCEGFRATYPTALPYPLPESQFAFATDYLQHHLRDVRLVTIQLGANDLFLCQQAALCTGSTDYAAIAQHVRMNMNTILRGIEATGYKGPIVVVTYYSLNYASAQENMATLLLNGGLDAAAVANGARIASGYLAFLLPSLRAGGNPVDAGLVYPDDVHPTTAGQMLLAQAVEAVIPR